MFRDVDFRVMSERTTNVTCVARLYRLMALRTTYISRVAGACFASWLRDILCHARTDFRESD